MSGEIIQMHHNQNLIFEPADLEAASPATVSRCGMIYMEPSQLGIQPIITSWLQHKVPNGCSAHQTQMLTHLITWLVPPVLQFIRFVFKVLFHLFNFVRRKVTLHFIYRRNGKFFLPMSDSHITSAVLKLYECFLLDYWVDETDSKIKIRSDEDDDVPNELHSDKFSHRLLMVFQFSLVWAAGK